MTKKFKKLLACLLAVAMLMSTVVLASAADPVAEEVNAANFKVITEVFEYSQDVVAVAIDAGAIVDGSSIDADTFTVSGRHINPTNGSATFDGEKVITDAYVNSECGMTDTPPEEGRYIILELEHGYNVRGASTLTFLFPAFRNIVLDLEYSIAQNEAYTLADGTSALVADFIQTGVDNLIVDDFLYEQGTQGNDYSYRLFIPEKEMGEEYPLVVWLHGMGETEYSVNGEPFGENEAQIRANMGGTAWAAPENQAENPSYVLAPQMRGAWNGEQAVALIKEVIAAYPDIDEDRIYIAGCSMGGMGTWDTILADPDLFAAAMPICPARAPSEEELATLVDLPIWIFQAANDTTVRPEGARDSFAKLTELGGDVKYTEFPDVGIYQGHWSWVPVLNNYYSEEYETSVFDWFYSQEKTSDDASVLDFDIVAEVFEYGQNTTALIVDAGRDVNGSTIAADTFKVSAINYNPSNGREAFNGERKVTNAYVSADAIVDGVADAAGRYIIIELEHGYNVRGATTLAYTGRNIELDMNYSIEQLKAYEFADGTAAEGLTYNQDGIINISVDNFMFGVGECGLEYRFFTPNRESGEKYPLVVWVHGGGEAGDNNTAQVLANMGATAWADPENQAENPSYVLAPQSPGSWDGEKVVSLVKEIISTHPDIDTTRVYVLGCSMGGAGTWNTIFADPDLFAAAMPICAALNPTEEQLATIADIPIWIIHAENDPTVPVANSREPFAKLQAMGVDVKYTEFENVDPYMGHWSWIPVLNNFYSEEYGTNVFDWLYSQKNESYKLVTEVLPYGQDVTAIVIDTQNDVAAADLSIENAKVYAENYKTDGSVAFDGERNITDIYVNNTGAKGDRSDYGRYIVIELEYGYGVSGATTHYYTGRNYYLDLNYDVDLTVGNYNFDTNYDQGETENLVVDDFEYIEYDGTFFRLYTPEEAGQGEALPLVIWNHGGGETYAESNGQDNEAMQIVANQGGVGFVVNNDEYPCYVLAPQRGTGTNYSREKVISFIDDLAAEGLVDNNRVYVAGCSAGGGETISFLKEYPQYFAAAVPICAAGQLSDANMAEITDIPVWFIHAANDPTVGVDSTRDKFERFTALDPYDVRYAEYEGVFGPDGFEYPNGHWSWIMFLANDYVEEYETTYFDWMFAQSKADVEEYTETAGENEAVSFKISTTDDVIGFILQNENGKKITITALDSAELAGGRLEWTITAKIGTAGSRELSLIPVSEDFGAMTAQKCDIEITAPENADDIIAAGFDVKAARVNSPFELTAISGGDVKRITVRNENGGKVGTTLVSNTMNDDGTSTFVYSMQVGTAGDRTFTISPNGDGNSVNASIIIV